MTTDRPTPRVDKLLTDETGARVIFHGTFSAPLCELARQLERELAAAKERSKVMEDWAQQEAALRDAAEAERDALRMDAERYRWLRHGDNDEAVLFFTKETSAGTDNVWLLRDESLDAAIDAAMKEPK